MAKRESDEVAADRARRKMHKKERELQARRTYDRHAVTLQSTANKTFHQPPIPAIFSGCDKKYVAKLRKLGQQRLENVGFNTVLDKFQQQRPFWINNPKDWKPSSHNARRAASSLARFLMAKYPVPGWLDAVYDIAGEHHNNFQRDSQDLFPHVGLGGSIKEFFEKREAWPNLTKKQAHLLLNTPTRMPLCEATRRAQMLSFGATARQTRAVCQTFVARQFFGAEEEYWSTVFQWLAANPMIATDQIQPMLDYFRFRKNQDRAFSLKGRSATRLFIDMQTWHQGMQKIDKAKKHQQDVYKLSGYAQGLYDVISNGKDWRWGIVELTSLKELMREGSVLRHCVYSYGSMVASGRISIWSMRQGPKSMMDDFMDAHKAEPEVTIEVENSTKDIVQVRGFGNRNPNVEELRIINVWAQQNGFVLRHY